MAAGSSFLADGFYDARKLWTFLEEEHALWYWQDHKHLARLASGKISDFYVNLTPLFTRGDIQTDVGEALRRGLIRKTEGNAAGAFIWRGAWFIGSAYGGIWLAMALQRSCRLGTKAGFTEKVQTTETMELKRFDLGKEPYVVLAEDVMTTGSTTRRTIDGIRDKHPDVKFHPVIAVVVNRSGARELTHGGDAFEILSLIDVPARTWESEAELPVGMRSCILIKPKDNWKALTEER